VRLTLVHRSVAGAGALALLVAGAPGAAAQVSCPPTNPQCQVTVPGDPGTPGSPGGPGGAPGPAGNPNGPIWRYFLGPANELSQLLLPPGTTQCYNTGLGGNMTLAEAIAAAGAQPDAPPCPDLSGLNGIPGAGGLTESVKARIPAPAPEIRPGRNITGLEAYLETGLAAFTSDESAGPFTVRFSLRPAEVRVDWGDGTPVETYDRPGVPYEERDGTREITHVYERSGRGECDDARYGSTCYVVTVDATWSWRAEVIAGPQVGLTFDGTYVDPRQGDLTLPVEEVQAVRNR
jgi:hypothetical protein